MKYFFFPLCFAIMLLSGCSAQLQEVPRIDRILAELHDVSSKNVLVAAHRGDWRNYPENSAEAVRSVIDMGVDIVEIDIAMTLDSVLILMHDRTIDRTTSGRGRVADITYDSICKCTLRLPHGVVSPYHIPTLQEILFLCKDRIVINIDKGYDYYDRVMKLLEVTGTHGQILIKGAKRPDEVSATIGKYDRNMLYMPIIDFRRSSANELFGLYAAGDPPVAYEIVWNEMTPEVGDCMKRVLANGSKLWTNSLWPSLCGGLDDDTAWRDGAEEVYGRHIAMGATMIQTDRPAFLLDYLRSKGLHD